MNPDRDVVFEDELGNRLQAYDEALAKGDTPAFGGEGEPAGLAARLERGRACLQLLQQLRPRQISRPPDMTSMSDGAAVPVVAAVPAEEKRGPEHIGRFEIRRTLGSGGFGVVYLAHDPVLCREVALKIPRAAVLADPDWLGRFQREARAAAALDHPNIVPVYEAGQLGPVNFITLAYCPGNNLAQWLKLRTAPFHALKAARLVLTLAQAIHHAHENGVLHRDLKPANILLSTESKAPSTGSEGPVLSALVPKITDFGLAKLLEGIPDGEGMGYQTSGGNVLGTPCYMAPEQAEGRVQDIGRATDVYALGAILYEVITGRPPFWGETAVAVFWQIKTAEPLAPGRLRADVPRDLETICLKCLHKEPGRRYESAAALADDLGRFLAGRPIQARPTGRVEQLAKWARRRPTLAAALAALVLVTSLGVGGILWQWLQTQDALADEAAALVQARHAQRAEADARAKSEVALYDHRVVLAHREWLAGDVGRASELLKKCPVEHRAWEWHYVRHLCDNDLLTLREHTASVMKVVFSPDGRWLASVTGQWLTKQPGEVKLWDAATGRLVWTGLGHSGPVMGVAFKPDGKHLASTSLLGSGGTGEIKIWETTTGKMLRTLPDPPAGSFSVAYSSDGKLLASGGARGTVAVWDPGTGKRLAVLGDPNSNVFDVAFSSDGRLLASASWDGMARVWDIAALRAGLNKGSGRTDAPPQPVYVLSGPIDLRSVAFSPDGKRLVAGSYDHRVKIWDMADGQVLRTFWEHRAAVLHATFTPDGRWVASADTGGNVHIWEARTGRLFRTVRGHTGPVTCIAFSSGGRRLATAGHDRVVRVWDFTREQESIQLGAVEPASNVVFSPDGKLLAASGYLHSSGSPRIKTVRVWPVDRWSRSRVWEGHSDWVTCVAFSPDSKLLASGSDDRTVRLWNVATGKTLHTLIDHRKRVTGVSFSPNGRCLVSASLDGTVKRWDVASGRLLAPVLTHPHPVQDVVYSRTGRVIAVGDDGMGKVWDPESGKALFTLKGHTRTVDRAVLSRDGALLATAGRDHSIFLWDLTHEPPAGADVGPRHYLLGPSETQRITGLAFSPDGRRLATSGKDHTIRIWDVALGNETLTLRGHQDYVTGVAFCPDDRFIASSSSLGIKIWQATQARSVSPRAVPAEREAFAWHRQQANECEAADPPEWFGVAFHVGRLRAAAPADWRWHGRLARAEVELGEWLRVLDPCSSAIARGATEPLPWYMQAVCRLQQGDTAGYRQSCAAMLERFARTELPEHANEVAWACALAPAAVPDLGPAVRLATRAARAERARSTYRNTLGAVLYRAKQFHAAHACLQESIQLSKGGNPEDWLFLAMLCHQKGEKAEARVWLDKAVHWRGAGRHLSGTDGQLPSLCRLTEIDLLCREAEATLAGRRITSP